MSTPVNNGTALVNINTSGMNGGKYKILIDYPQNNSYNNSNNKESILKLKDHSMPCPVFLRTSSVTHMYQLHIVPQETYEQFQRGEIYFAQVVYAAQELGYFSWSGEGTNVGHFETNKNTVTFQEEPGYMLGGYTIGLEGSNPFGKEYTIHFQVDLRDNDSLICTNISYEYE